jgi:hypothetical protein
MAWYHGHSWDSHLAAVLLGGLSCLNLAAGRELRSFLEQEMHLAAAVSHVSAARAPLWVIQFRNHPAEECLCHQMHQHVEYQSEACFLLQRLDWVFFLAAEVHRLQIHQELTAYFSWSEHDLDSHRLLACGLWQMVRMDGNQADNLPPKRGSLLQISISAAMN